MDIDKKLLKMAVADIQIATIPWLCGYMQQSSNVNANDEFRTLAPDKDY